MFPFSIQFEAFDFQCPNALGLCFKFVHNQERHARVCAVEIELWTTNPRDGIGPFVARLSPDIRWMVTAFSNDQPALDFKGRETAPYRVLWHYTPEQIQKVEDFRRGDEAFLEVRAMFVVQSLTPAARPTEQPKVEHAIETPGHNMGWPMRIQIPESEWIKVLDKIGFRSPITDRLPWPVLPPAFKRAESHLNDAWNYYRTGDADGTLSACYKAFECLGFDLLGKILDRRTVVQHLLDNAEAEKIDAILALLKSLQDYFHLGRHDRRTPVTLTIRNAQLAVISSAALLSYLGVPRP
jgi:hypothetical protein